jgi:methionyl aminopeptidase
MIHLKTAEEILIMRAAGRIVAAAHAEARAMVRPGVTTAQIDEVVERTIRKHGAIPTFIGYPPGSAHPFPAATTISINHELVHGIPSPQRVLQEGDIVSIDCAATYKGFVADGGFTMGVGRISPEAQRLIEIGEEALRIGIQNAVLGKETRDIAIAIQTYVERQGCSVIREYTGHGVGRAMHEEPQVPNWWPRGRKQRAWRSYPLQVGMTFALEPMISLGSPKTQVLDDHWTVVMADGALCTWTEHTIAVTDGEPLILTLP